MFIDSPSIVSIWFVLYVERSYVCSTYETGWYVCILASILHPGVIPTVPRPQSCIRGGMG